MLEIDIYLVRIADAETPADYRSLRRIARMQRACGYRLGSRVIAGIEFFDDAVKLHGREIFVKVVIDLHGWRAGTCADAFDFFERENPVGGDFFVADFQALLCLPEGLRCSME